MTDIVEHIWPERIWIYRELMEPTFTKWSDWEDVWLTDGDRENEKGMEPWREFIEYAPADTITTLKAELSEAWWNLDTSRQNERNLQASLAKARRQERVAKKLVAKAYTIISLVAGDLADEGDRVYLRSTNTADILRDAREEWDAHKIIGADLLPLIEENRVLKARAETSEAALRSQRAEVLLEAAAVARRHGDTRPQGKWNTAYLISESILALIDAPKEQG